MEKHSSICINKSEIFLQVGGYPRDIHVCVKMHGIHLKICLKRVSLFFLKEVNFSLVLKIKGHNNVTLNKTENIH